MRRTTAVVIGILGVGLIAVGLTALPQLIPATEGAQSQKAMKVTDKKDTLAVEVVLEEVSLRYNTITARATSHVVPPSSGVGGAVFMMGTTTSPHSEKATRFVRLPVMPDANIKNEKLKAGTLAILHLEMIRQGVLVVVGIEEFRGPERVGIESLDAAKVN